MGRLMGRHVLACAMLAIAVDGRSTAAQVSAPKVPDSAQALEGSRVLLIILERTPQTACVAAGTAHWTGAALEVRAGPQERAAVAVRSPRALRPFSPTTLSRLIVPEHDYESRGPRTWRDGVRGDLRSGGSIGGRRVGSAILWACAWAGWRSLPHAGRGTGSMSSPRIRAPAA